ncbi:MAG: hypothetical protein ACD_14C00013G0001 [uncultured bacterium]|nr:MAG: hypothetical protein ACD_14C00013G0001 [uncultured bacterium]
MHGNRQSGGAKSTPRARLVDVLSSCQVRPHGNLGDCLHRDLSRGCVLGQRQQ